MTISYPAQQSLLTGFSVGMSLILVIGAQNAFVLRQGLKREHVLSVVLTCALSDSLLIFFGVSSFRIILKHATWIDPVMRYGGALFLFMYGCRSMLSAIKSSDKLVAAQNIKEPLPKVLATCLALTWLNPHVYLDTVALIGAISTQFIPWQYFFALGASVASFVFFFSLGYGAYFLQAIFAKSSSWRILEAVIAIVMWVIAVKLLVGISF